MKATGFWVFEVEVVEEVGPFAEPGESTPELGNAATYDTELVYKKVTVDTSEDDTVAYYHQQDIGPDTDLDRLREREGRVYVPMEQVRKHPPKDAKPYREVADV